MTNKHYRSHTFKKERLWLEHEKDFFTKLVKYFFVPVMFFWLFIDIAFVALANYYFENVIFGPIFHFTPMQTLIVTILLAFFVYAIYKTLQDRRS